MYVGATMLFETGAIGGSFQGCVFRLINLRAADIEEAIDNTINTTGSRVYGATVLLSGGSVSK